jgi:hypothetical protein
VRRSATASHAGMIRNPWSIWPFLLNKLLADRGFGTGAEQPARRTRDKAGGPRNGIGPCARLRSTTARAGKASDRTALNRGRNHSATAKE